MLGTCKKILTWNNSALSIWKDIFAWNNSALSIWEDISETIAFDKLPQYFANSIFSKIMFNYVTIHRGWTEKKYTGPNF